MAAEAEADREHGRGTLITAQALCCRGDVRVDRLSPDPHEVLHEGETVATRLRPCRPAVPIDREGYVTLLGEARRELLVERMQPSVVRKNDDADTGGGFGALQEGAR